MANFIDKGATVVASPVNNADLFAEALNGAISIQKGYIRVLPKVSAGGVRLKKLFATSDGTFVQADGRDCSWDATEAAELALKTVTPVAYKINLEECGESWDAVRSEDEFYGIKYGQLNQDDEAAILKYVARRLSVAIENQVWSDITTEAASDSDVIDVTATTLTTANILEEVEKVYLALPDAVVAEAALDPVKGQLYNFMNPGDYRKLRVALGEAATKTNVVDPKFSYVDGVVRFMDMICAPVNGIAANKMVAGSYQNFVCVSNLMSDAEIKARYGADLSDENILKIKANYLLKGSYAFGAEVVAYGL